MASNRDLSSDILFVGLTRPATMWGIPYMAFVIEFMAVTLIFLAVGNPLYLLLGAPIHAILYLISAHDPNIFHSLYLWVRTFGRCRNRHFWNACSFSPLPDRKRRNNP